MNRLFWAIRCRSVTGDFLIGFQMKKTAVALGIVGSSLLVAGSAMAAASAEFTTAVTTVTADVATYGGALVGVAAVGVGFMIAIKYIRKIRGAA